MLPLTFLAATLIVTLAAFVRHLLMRRRAARRLSRLAGQWGMHYAAEDRFRLTPRVAERFAVPGASDFVILDLIYAQEREQYRYLFTVEYTAGVVRAKRRERRVAMLLEPRDGRAVEGWSPLMVAPADRPVVEQYAMLRDNSQPGEGSDAGAVQAGAS